MKKRKRRFLLDDDEPPKPSKKEKVKSLLSRQKSLEEALNDTSMALTYILQRVQVDDMFRKRAEAALNLSYDLIGSPRRPVMRRRL